MEIFAALVELTIINLILSIDNAILIASVSKDLPDDKRKKVSFFGTTFALIVRFFFIIIFLYLFKEEFASIYLIGGIFLIGIGLFITNKKSSTTKKAKHDVVFKLIIFVVLIDILMSFDNALVVAELASKLDGQIFWQMFIILFALGMSFPIILFGANKFGEILHKKRWIIYVASFILISIGVEMICDASFIWSNINFEETTIYQKLLLKTFVYSISGILVIMKYFFDRTWNNKVKNTDEDVVDNNVNL